MTSSISKRKLPFIDAGGSFLLRLELFSYGSHVKPVGMVS
jgi:hypothetical protein